VAGEQELGSGWKWITQILEDRKGNLWFSMPGHGVCKYDGKTFTKFTTENGLPNNPSFSLLEDQKGNIWIGTVGGACRYDGQNFRAFTTKDGLTGGWIQSIAEDRRGNLWLSVGTGGVHKFDGRNFQTFTTDDGLLGNESYGILEDETGNLIFATSRGFTIYTPPKENIAPPILVTEVVADKVYPVNPSAPPLPPTLGGKGGRKVSKSPPRRSTLALPITVSALRPSGCVITICLKAMTKIGKRHGMNRQVMKTSSPATTLSK
jgi:hypothetical protein